MVFSSQRREMVVFLITNIYMANVASRANEWKEHGCVCVCVGGGGGRGDRRRGEENRGGVSAIHAWENKVNTLSKED